MYGAHPPATFGGRGEAAGRVTRSNTYLISGVSWAYGDWPARIPARPVRRAGSGAARRVVTPDHARSRRLGGHQAGLDGGSRRAVRTAAPRRAVARGTA